MKTVKMMLVAMMVLTVLAPAAYGSKVPIRKWRHAMPPGWFTPSGYIQPAPWPGTL